MFRNKLASLEATPVQNYELTTLSTAESAVYSVELQSIPKKA